MGVESSARIVGVEALVEGTRKFTFVARTRLVSLCESHLIENV